MQEKTKRTKHSGFTLFEVMASFAVLTILLYALFVVFDQASRVINQGTSSADQYQNARMVLDQMQRDISQIVLGQGGPVAVSSFSKNSSYLYGTDGTKTIGGISYDRDGIFFSAPVATGYNEVGYYISNPDATNVREDYLQRLVSSKDSTYMGFSVDNISTSFGDDEKYGFYITDLNIEYKRQAYGDSPVIAGETFDEWDSRFDTINGTTATWKDDGRLPDTIVITIKTVSKQALEKAGGIPTEGARKTFSIQIPMTEKTTYQIPK